MIDYKTPFIIEWCRICDSLRNFTWSVVVHLEAPHHQPGKEIKPHAIMIIMMHNYDMQLDYELKISMSYK